MGQPTFLYERILDTHPVRQLREQSQEAARVWNRIDKQVGPRKHCGKTLRQECEKGYTHVGPTPSSASPSVTPRPFVTVTLAEVYRSIGATFTDLQ